MKSWIEVGFDGIAAKRPRWFSDMHIYCLGNINKVFHVPRLAYWSPSAPNGH